jgi:demethylmenaquinone methyltransferase/2-methoxy-6-polyprenyl-1,4-benzoquinol methylase
LFDTMAAVLNEIQGVKAAQRIFTDISEAYDGPAQVLGLFQYRSWHRALVDSIVEVDPKLVLDMCTGTGAVAAEIIARTGSRVVGADVTWAMLEKARPRLRSVGRRIALIQADAQAPPFADGAFDAVVWSYLLRYVEDVPATILKLGRLVRPGGVMASLEFGVPRAPLARAAWITYTRAIMPPALALLSRGWRRVGGFLGKSISAFDEEWPVERLADAWRLAGFDHVSARRLSLGGAVVMSGGRRS